MAWVLSCSTFMRGTRISDSLKLNGRFYSWKWARYPLSPHRKQKHRINHWFSGAILSVAGASIIKPPQNLPHSKKELCFFDSSRPLLITNGVIWTFFLDNWGETTYNPTLLIWGHISTPFTTMEYETPIIHSGPRNSRAGRMMASPGKVNDQNLEISPIGFWKTKKMFARWLDIHWFKYSQSI